MLGGMYPSAQPIELRLDSGPLDGRQSPALGSSVGLKLIAQVDLACFQSGRFSGS